MHDTSEFPAEPPGAARAAGLRRLSRLTWRATQLSAVAAVGFAALFARTAPAQKAAGCLPRHTPGPAAAAARRRRKGVELEMTVTLRVNPIACTGHGMCAELLPEAVELDRWGYPLLVSPAIPRA